jgi:acetyltransferase-like isoleucine patch superfamily enzyme
VRHQGARLARGLRGVFREGASRRRIGVLRILYPGLTVEGRVSVAAGCDIQVLEGGELILRDCFVSRGVTLVAGRGAVLDVAAGIIGPHSTLVARESVVVGRGSKIAEGVVVRDADHDHRKPLEDGVFITAPIDIGRDVWLAAGTTVLSGVTIGDGATIGAGAVVTSSIPAGVTAVGIPARPLAPRVV